MDPHDGMRHRGTLLEPSLAGAVETRIVQDHSPLDTLLQFLRQRVVGRVHSRERCLAAVLRRLDGVQQARRRRVLHEVQVAVPQRLAVTQAAEGATALDHVGDDHHFRMLGDVGRTVLERGRNLHLAEAAGERHESRVVEILVPDPEHRVFEPRPPERRDHVVVETRRQVDTPHLGAKRRRQRRDLERRGAAGADRALVAACHGHCPRMNSCSARALSSP